jgi:hypothetical protein
MVEVAGVDCLLGRLGAARPTWGCSADLGLCHRRIREWLSSQVVNAAGQASGGTPKTGWDKCMSQYREFDLSRTDKPQS